MADKRMFTMKIVDSDAFLDMPLSTQALYFHLNMRADDDGFVNNPKKICRLIGATDDDLKILIMKSFVLVFESGVIVIKHWKMNNTLRNDRYRPTSYQEEFKLLGIKDNSSYTWQPNGNQMATNGIPNGNQMATTCIPNGTTDIDIDKNSIDLDKIKNREYIVASNSLEAQISSEITSVQDIFNYWNSKKIVNHRILTSDISKAIEEAISLYGVDNIKNAISHYSTILEDKNCYFSYKWVLKDFLKRNNALPEFLEGGTKWDNYVISSQGKKSKEKSLLNNLNKEEILNDFK